MGLFRKKENQGGLCSDPFDGVWEMYYIMIIMVVLFLAFMICIAYFEFRENQITTYKMPNGVICESDMTTGGGFGGATHEFYDCDDGNVYINPESYVIIKDALPREQE